MKGRKPTPTILKLLAGNPGKRPLPEGEPVPTTPLPGCPADMPAAGREKWAVIVQELGDCGVLTGVDAHAMEVLCRTWARMLEAAEHVREEGAVVEVRGLKRRNPWATLERECARDVQRLMVEFGMTPSSRTRVRVANSSANRDSLEEFIAKKRRKSADK